MIYLKRIFLILKPQIFICFILSILFSLTYLIFKTQIFKFAEIMWVLFDFAYLYETLKKNESQNIKHFLKQNGKSLILYNFSFTLIFIFTIFPIIIN